MAKNKGKKGNKRAVAGVGGSAVAKLGPAPGVPKLPKVDIDLGIGKIATDLAAARKEGKGAAKGQLASIDQAISKTGQRQSNKYDQRTDKIMRNMRRLDKQTRLFNANRQAGINATNQNIMRNATPGPGSGGLDVGITGSRSALLKSQGKVTQATTKAGVQAGRAMKQAGQKAVDATPRIQQKSARTSMSILDVLAAERKSDDVRYLSELRMQERQLELSQAHDLRMAQMNFQNDLYMQQYSTALEKDYQTWQYEQGYLETPDQERAAEFKTWKMKQNYLNKIETNKDKNGHYKKFSRAVDTAESVNAAAATITSDPGFNKAVKTAMQNEENAGMSEAAIRANLIAQNMVGTYAPPEDQAAVADGVVNYIARNGTTPTFEEVREIISANDPDHAAKYINTANPAKLDRIHQDYRAINAAVLGTEQYKNVSGSGYSKTDPSVLPAGTVPLDMDPASAVGGGGDEPRAGDGGFDFGPVGTVAATGAMANTARRRGRELRAAEAGSYDDLPRRPFRDMARGAADIIKTDISIDKTMYNEVRDLMDRGMTRERAVEHVKNARQGLARVIKGVHRDKISRGIVSAHARPGAADEIARELSSLAAPDEETVRSLDVQRERAAMKSSFSDGPVTGTVAEEAMDVDAINDARVARQRAIREAEEAASAATRNPDADHKFTYDTSTEKLPFEGDEGDSIPKKIARVFKSEAGEAAAGTLRQGARAAGKVVPIAGAVAEALVIGDQAADILRGRVATDENAYHATAQSIMKVAQDELFTGDTTPAEFHERIKRVSIERPSEWAGNLSDEEKWNLYQYGVRALHDYYAQQRDK